MLSASAFFLPNPRPRHCHTHATYRCFCRILVQPPSSPLSANSIYERSLMAGIGCVIPRVALLLGSAQPVPTKIFRAISNDEIAESRVLSRQIVILLPTNFIGRRVMFFPMSYISSACFRRTTTTTRWHRQFRVTRRGQEEVTRTSVIITHSIQP